MPPISRLDLTFQAMTASEANPGQPSHSGAVFVALLVTVPWSSPWILIREGLDSEDLSPVGFAALRYRLASLVLVGWVLARPVARAGLRGIDRRSLSRIALLGLVFYAVTQGAQFVAIDNQLAATTSLVLSMTHLLVAALAARAITEIPTRRQWSAAALVGAGAWLFFSGSLGATAAGATAAMVALVANVVSSLLGRSVNRPATFSTTVVTALSLAVGSVILVVLAIATEGLPSVSGRACLIIA
jgi:drug/metabolite transporter (DMT)-like permease